MAEGDNDDDSQKTEEPTARKLEEARKRGQVINSREVTNWALLFAATLVIVGGGPLIADGLRDLLRPFLAQPHDMPVDSGNLGDILGATLGGTALLLALPLLLIALAALLSVLLQTGILFTAEPIKPDLKKISLISGFGRLFSMRAVMEFLKGLAKLGLVGTAGALAIMPFFDGAEHFIGLDLNQSLFEIETIFLRMMVAVLMVLFVIAAADYAYQRYDFMQKMRMSKQEIKDEFKQTEGDPHVKGRLRQLREQKARQRMMQAVPTADVVITNPTHYAVALKYDMKEMDAPQMVAKGIDAVAQRIKDTARENKVPVVENPVLARALFDSMELDQTIPAEHFKAVAEVISYVFKLKGRKA